MSMGERARQAVGRLTGGGQAGDLLDEVAERFAIDSNDFLSARERGEMPGTRIAQMSAGLTEAGEIVNRSFPERTEGGAFTNVISPVVIPERRTLMKLAPAGLLILFGLIGTLLSTAADRATGIDDSAVTLFGPHYWVVVAAVGAFIWWRNSVVMVPDGCRALITKFGKLVQVAEAGRTLLVSPWKQVSYFVNTTREYPYNAPIREAPTESGVKASVDLFLQFRIEDPAEFIFTLGAVKGFADKLQNAISEVTRALIYGQRAEDIYDLVGESTQDMLQSLNQQFLPAVRFTNANITHAEPSSQEYRMDLAAPEMLRVAKEAYTYEYELQLRKQQNEGELNKELASLRETLSAIRAEIATYQAQMDTAYERETNRAEAVARQRLVEAESTANANAALLEAQALDIKALSGADAPEILEYRFQEEVLDQLAAVADRMPQLVQIGGDSSGALDFTAIARQMVGSRDEALFSHDDMQAIRRRVAEIKSRIERRESEIEILLADDEAREQIAPAPIEEIPGEQRVEEIRQSVTDEEIARRVERIAEVPPGQGPPSVPAPEGGDV